MRIIIQNLEWKRSSVISAVKISFTGDIMCQMEQNQACKQMEAISIRRFLKKQKNVLRVAITLEEILRLLSQAKNGVIQGNHTRLIRQILLRGN